MLQMNDSLYRRDTDHDWDCPQTDPVSRFS